ncbi:unnamed protein product [Ectocarpus sp. 4 AP-2014]
MCPELSPLSFATGSRRLSLEFVHGPGGICYAAEGARRGTGYIGRIRAMGLSATLSHRRNGGGGHVTFGPLHALQKCWGGCGTTEREKHLWHAEKHLWHAVR